MNTFTTFYGKGLDCIPKKPLAVIKHDFIKSLAYFTPPFPLHSILATCRMVLQTKNHICQLSKIHSQWFCSIHHVSAKWRTWWLRLCQLFFASKIKSKILEINPQVTNKYFSKTKNDNLSFHDEINFLELGLTSWKH